MEMLIGVLLLFQMLLLIKLFQMGRQILQQMEEQKEKLTRITEQNTVQKTVEKAPASFAVSGQAFEEKKRAKASEQEKLIDEVLSEIFPA